MNGSLQIDAPAAGSLIPLSIPRAPPDQRQQPSDVPRRKRRSAALAKPIAYAVCVATVALLGATAAYVTLGATAVSVRVGTARNGVAIEAPTPSLAPREPSVGTIFLPPVTILIPQVAATPTAKKILPESSPSPSVPPTAARPAPANPFTHAAPAPEPNP